MPHVVNRVSTAVCSALFPLYLSLPAARPGHAAPRQVRRFFDYVRVYGGDTTDAPLLGIISGDHFNHSSTFLRRYTADGPDAALLIHFVTTDTSGPASIPQYGFQVTYSAPFCGNATGEALSAVRGTLTDGSGDAPFVPLSRCAWVIQPGGQGVRVVMSHMALRAGVDAVRIYEGRAVNASRMLAEWSGTYDREDCMHEPRYSASTPGDAVTVEFVAGAAPEDDDGSAGELMGGWELEWMPAPSCQRGPVTLTEPTGVLTDGSQWGKTYAPFTLCTWHIAPSIGRGPVTLVIEDFRSNDHADFLFVYGGNSTEQSRLLKQFTGQYHFEVRSQRWQFSPTLAPPALSYLPAATA